MVCPSASGLRDLLHAGTNLVDATETVNKIAEDEHIGVLPTSKPADPWQGLQEALERKGIQVGGLYFAFDYWRCLCAGVCLEAQDSLSLVAKDFPD